MWSCDLDAIGRMSGGSSEYLKKKANKKITEAKNDSNQTVACEGPSAAENTEAVRTVVLVDAGADKPTDQREGHFSELLASRKLSV